MEVLDGGEEGRGVRVGGDATGGGQKPGGAVTQAAVNESGNLCGVGDAASEGGFGEALPFGVTQGLCGELLGAGDAGGAVAPGRP